MNDILIEQGGSIALLGQFEQNPHRTKIRAACGALHEVYVAKPEGLVAETPVSEVVAVAGPPAAMTARNLELLPRLKWVHVMAAGVDQMADGLAVAKRRDIRVTCTRGASAAPLAEYAVLMMLAFAKDLPRWLAQQRGGVWGPKQSLELAGATCGIIGTGYAGRQIARCVKTLGMQTIGMNRSGRLLPEFDSVVDASQVTIVMRASDYVVVAAPLTPSTRGLIGLQELNELRDSAVLVVLSRAGLVDEASLISVLASGQLRGAALDAFETEPLPISSPLWNLPNVILTPHVAGATAEMRDRSVDILCENIVRFRRGGTLLAEVDLTLEY